MLGSSFFSQAARWTSRQCGQPLTFGVAVAIVAVWGITGPLFDYSDTWQLVINTGTTIITFLMVFLIQNTQNREAVAVQLKLDELIRVSKTARNKLLMLEDLTDEELEQLKGAFARIATEGAAMPEETQTPAGALAQADGAAVERERTIAAAAT